MNNHLTSMRDRLKRVKSLLNRASARQVQAQSIITASKNLVNHYFNNIRPVFRSNGLDDESLGGLDNGHVGSSLRWICLCPQVRRRPREGAIGRWLRRR